MMVRTVMHAQCVRTDGRAAPDPFCGGEQTILPEAERISDET
jgi:hypothetical protein